VEAKGKTTLTVSAGPHTAKKRLEKIRKAATRSENIFSAAIHITMAATAAVCAKIGVFILPPVRPQLVVFFPLFRIAKYLVSLCDFLKFFFRNFISGVFVRMIPECKPPVSLLDLLLGSLFTHAKHCIIVFKIHCSRLSRVLQYGGKQMK